MQNLFRDLYLRMPAKTRHYIWRTNIKYRYPRRYDRLQRLRRVNKNGYSLKPFDEHKCIFVHIPRCAGSSICKSLFGNYAGGHKTIKEYQIVFSPKELSEYFKFSIVRNPWDRLVSAFFFLKKGGMNDMDRKWATENLSSFQDFNTFVRKWLNNDSVRLYHHFKPQSFFICGDDKKPQLDFIGTFENLEQDYKYIKERIGLSSDLIVSNRGQREDYRKYYCKDTIKIVSDIYANDIQLLGYSFDN